MAQASAEKLERTAPAEKERVASVSQIEQLAVCQSNLCHKEKETEPSVRITRSGDGREPGEREPHLGEREGDQSGIMRRKEWTPQ